MKEISRLPDPDRAANNIESFLSAHPELEGKVETHRDYIAALFSHSQFLANYCNIYPASLFSAIDNFNRIPARQDLTDELEMLMRPCEEISEGMQIIRRFRKDKQIGITLRDILGFSGLQEVVFELSDLADVILSVSLAFVSKHLDQRYGSPIDNSVSMIGLGKLGARELNYSSDVDIVFVYRQDGETAGVESVPGIMMNRVSAFEYYAKLVEDLTRFVASNTEDGFAYRVDLRLRPEGQRGSLALSLKAYEDYYEAWGQLWEKAALLRARHIAGDEDLGNEFIAVITPFIYRKYLDLDTIHEIKRMKLQVEQLKSGTFSRDIKRGFGGIREIEFFIQIFQLMYGGKVPALREKSTLKALHKLVQKGLVGHEDMGCLSDNYLFLRTLEHRIQQMNDIQTHSLPAGERELYLLGRKMGFADSKAFLEELAKRRSRVRSVYDSLFQGQGAGPDEETGESVLTSLRFWDVEMPIRQPLEEELLRRGVKEAGRAVHHLVQIRNNMHAFQTIRGRRLLADIVPRFAEKAIDGGNPDEALLQLTDFSRLLAASESYLDSIIQRPEIIDHFTFVFSHSDYLSKVLMSNPEYMESLAEITVKAKDIETSVRELDLLIERKGESAAIRIYRRLEEIRLGILLLNREISAIDLMRGISTVAEAVFCSLRTRHPARLAVVAFGKLGGREIIFNSDLDVVFVTPGMPEVSDIKDAENLIKLLMSYTKDGVAYKVDTRLRPDGNKGPLVSSIRGMTDYYMNSAQPWELQALLKARIVSGDLPTIRAFVRVRRQVLQKRAAEISIHEIRNMRERIRRELSKDDMSSGHHDIKLGTGGLEDLEFAIQYLQLCNCVRFPYVAVQGTLEAIRRLGRAGVITAKLTNELTETYILYRTLETVLRLRSDTLLKEGSGTAQSAASLTGQSEGELFNLLKQRRAEVALFMESLAS